MRIGIFDSGLGGLTVLRALKTRAPGAEYVYLGDTARTPYGTKSPSTVVRYAKECGQFLLAREIDLLVVACNTASSLALSALEAECTCPVIGTIDPAISACLSIGGSRIGVIGTNATIASGIYEAGLKRKNPSLKVFSKACPLFVPLVEEGIVQGDIPTRIVEHYLAELSHHGIETLILACTHYPLLANLIGDYLGANVHVVDCAGAIAEQVWRRFPSLHEDSNARPSVEYFVTDEPGRFNYLVNLLLDAPANAVKLESL